MRRLSITALFLVVLSACTAAPPPPANSTPSNSNLSASPTPKTISDAEIENQEKQIWDSIKTKNYDQFAWMLADDFIEVYSGGVSNKNTTIADVKKFDPTDIQLSDWKVRKLGPDAALVTYILKLRGKFDGEPMPEESTRSSSVWVNRGGKWLTVFHQVSIVKKAQTTSTTPASASSPAPAGSTTAAPLATTSDVVANEKAVWSALKAKNFDAFGPMLADDFIDIEHWNVYDKVSFLEAFKSANFSDPVTDNYRTVDLGSDAKLVTYTLKVTEKGKTMQSYETTIWANRGGKWVAAFHQGTEAQPAG